MLRIQQHERIDHQKEVLYNMQVLRKSFIHFTSQKEGIGYK